jgi:hypothetical protein
MSIFTPHARQFLPFLLVLFSAMAPVAAYLQALYFPFISDDEFYITKNAGLLGLHLADLWRLFIEPYNPFEFLPLRDLSYWFDIALFGLTPSAFRVHNIVLYVLCLPLVYATTLGLWRYFRPADIASAAWASAAVTALFALHPAHVEAVVWISGRKDVLSGMFSLLALWLAVNARREQGLSHRYAIASLLALLAAMLSKATAVAVAPVIAMLWIIFWRDVSAPNKHRSHLLWAFASLLLAGCVALIFMAHSTIKEPAYFGIEFFTRVLAILGWLARLSISPESRHFFYPVFEDSKLWVMVGLGVLILLAALVAMLTMLRKRTVEGLALGIFLLLCLPFTQLIPFGTSSLVSDRFLFLAAWPVALLLVVLAWRFKPLPRTILLLVIVLAWGTQTFERPREWRSEEVLVDTELHAYPGHYLPAFQRIWVQLRLGMYSDAIETSNRIELPEFRNTMNGMIQATYAVRSATTGKPDEAMAALQNFEIAINQLPIESNWNAPMRYVRERCKDVLELKWARLAEQFPNDALVRYMAGLWKLNANNYKDAATHLRAAVDSQFLPESTRGAAFKNLGLALMGSENVAEAEVPLRVALQQSPPDFQAYCILVDLYKKTGRSKEAASAESDCRSHTLIEEAAR